MALLKGKATSKAVELYQPPEVPETIPRDQWDRPLIVPLDGGKPMAYTRASTLGKAIEDTYHLSRWQRRTVAYGLSRRPDLVALVAAVATNEGTDRSTLDELCDKAHEAGKGDQGANVGTALHKLSERRDVGEDLSYLREDLLAALDAYSEQIGLFKILASETFVVCDPLLTAGSFDRVVMLLVDLEFRHAKLGRVVIPAGTVLVLDLKTGKLESAKYWGPAYGVQQTVYACGQPYRHDEGRMDWEEILGPGLAPSTRWALILHVPGDSPKDAGLVVVDLDEGKGMADLCLEIRTARKNKALLSDAYPVQVAPLAIEAPPTIGEMVQDELDELDENGPSAAMIDLFELIAQADASALDRVWMENQNLWGDEHTEAVRARLAELTDPGPCNPCAHGGTHGSVCCSHCEQQTEYEGEAYCAEHGERPELIEVPESALAALREPNPAGAKLKLITQLRQAPDEAALTALWEANQDRWTDDATRMARARLAELSNGALT